MAGTLDQQLFAAIDQENVLEVRRLLAEATNPNCTNELGDCALSAACDSWNEPKRRFAMVEALLKAGANPNLYRTGIDPLFKCVLAKDAHLIACLLESGADPNRFRDGGETLYDWAEFDYRYDEYDLRLPDRPTAEDKQSEEAWLLFLEKLAVKYGKRPPDYLRALRKGGALRKEELDKLSELRMKPEQKPTEKTKPRPNGTAGMTPEEREKAGKEALAANLARYGNKLPKVH